VGMGLRARGRAARGGVSHRGRTGRAASGGAQGDATPRPHGGPCRGQGHHRGGPDGGHAPGQWAPLGGPDGAAPRGRAGGRAHGERGRRERRGEGKGGGAHLGIRRSAATVHRMTPRAREVEERWKRGRGKLLHGKRK
jgi:hypothetical protein